MEMLTFCLMVILFTTFTSLIYSEKTSTMQLQGMNISFGFLNDQGIFNRDIENRKLLIDIKKITGKLTKIQVKKGEILIIDDTIDDLTQNEIYEVNLDSYEIGDYAISLITNEEEIIQESFSIHE